jgi:membrane protein
VTLGERGRDALRRAGELARRAVREFFADRCPLIAAAISYYALFSLFPLTILVVSGLALVLEDANAREEVIDFVVRNLPLRPGEGRRELSDLLQSVTSGAAGFGVVGAIGLAVAASGLISAVRGGINAAWDAEKPRPPLQGKLLDIVLVVGVGMVVALSLTLTLLTRLVASAGRELDGSLGGAGGAAAEAVLAVGQLAPLLVSAGVFLFLFRVLPAPETHLRDIWPGVLVATLGYEVAKTGFSIYLEHFANYGAVYGSLGVVLAFLVFVFVAANVFLLAAEVASEWPRVRAAQLEPRDEAPPLRERLRKGLKRLVVRQE